MVQPHERSDRKGDQYDCRKHVESVVADAAEQGIDRAIELIADEGEEWAQNRRGERVEQHKFEQRHPGRADGDRADRP